MKEGLLEKITGYGHWRVNLRPLAALPERLTLARCFEVVEQSRVSIRGWDYPHISRREDAEGGSGRAGEYFENWCDWHSQVEFWRMYRSGQFLSYNTLNDDTEVPPEDAGKLLNVVDAIYTVSEFTDFAGRLVANVPFAAGLHLALTLNGTAGRRLWSGRNRVPFFDAKTTEAPLVELNRRIAPGDNAQELAISLLVELFDHFGWNPDPSQLQGDQSRFYRRES
ncbi:MAG: hypothetical protein ABSF67_24710 [Roseiarcus sp.]|jgi:hypothetical protein